MAKDKKRGFFSWFGRGRQEEEQQKEEIREEQPVIEEQSVVEEHAVVEEHPLAEEPGVPVEQHPGEWDTAASAESAAEIAPVVEPEP